MNKNTKTLKKFYFTFGLGHKHENGFHVIEAESRNEARDKMFERFGTEGAFEYSEEEWIKNVMSQQEEYNLHEVKYSIMTNKFAPVGWFINNKTVKHYIDLIDIIGRSSPYKQSMFKKEVRNIFEKRMFGNYDDHSEYYVTTNELDEIYKKYDK